MGTAIVITCIVYIFILGVKSILQQASKQKVYNGLQV